MLSRRDFFGVTLGLTSAGWLCAQDAQRPGFFVKVRFTVTEDTRYVNGVKPKNIRLFEDGILQKILTFAEGSERPLLVNDDGTTRPMDAQSASQASKPGLDLDASKSARDDLHNSYTITYYPNPSNHNEGLRKIRFEIVPDMLAKKWRVRSRPGYGPEERTPEDQRK